MKPLTPLTYVAGPYTHPEWSVKVERFKQLTEATRYLMETYGWNCFSPITHSHPLHEAGMRGDWAFWARIDEEYLEVSDKIIICLFEGWTRSVGVSAERAIALRKGVPIFYFNPYLKTIYKHDGSCTLGIGEQIEFIKAHQSEGPGSNVPAGPEPVP